MTDNISTSAAAKLLEDLFIALQAFQVDGTVTDALARLVPRHLRPGVDQAFLRRLLCAGVLVAGAGPYAPPRCPAEQLLRETLLGEPDREPFGYPLPVTPPTRTSPLPAGLAERFLLQTWFAGPVTLPYDEIE